MDIAGALEWLEGKVNLEATGPGRVEPTLERMTELVAALGDPQDAVPTIHLTGTNGKGSVARMVAALLGAHDLLVGTYGSPHLERINERIQLAGRPCDDATLAAGIGAVAAVEPLLAGEPSWFELVTAAAYAVFADVPTHVNVIEVGLGGRWDATNVVAASVAGVTNVGLDHLEYFGPTRDHVAAEKAGIIDPGAHLVLGESDPELRHHFEQRSPGELWLRDRDFACSSNEVAVGGRLLDLRTPGAAYDQVFVPLHGAVMGDNAAMALALVEAFFGRPVPEDLVHEAFAMVSNPGRFELVAHSPTVILDGAHNADGMRAVVDTVTRDIAAAGDRVLVVGFNQGRDPGELLGLLAPLAPRHLVVTAADWQRALPATEVASEARRLGFDVELVEPVGSALERARALAGDEDLVLVTGSLYVVGEARHHLGVPWPS